MVFRVFIVGFVGGLWGEDFVFMGYDFDASAAAFGLCSPCEC